MTFCRVAPERIFWTAVMGMTHLMAELVMTFCAAATGAIWSLEGLMTTL
ncbi:hypothetical protein BOA8489_01245 [Boseongicola aestuarii]|uniref:Uncharacterized protein n=1 Tax=Boseongicola aestuarii TaxID=1470561 RepID=A0A238IYT6_9RHOB|nr:hypothetical protein BOA8489_01245 [Boseongicola aestuarii]